MTMKIGWLHEAEHCLGTWLREADDWHPANGEGSGAARTLRLGLEGRGHSRLALGFIAGVAVLLSEASSGRPERRRTSFPGPR